MRILLAVCLTLGGTHLHAQEHPLLFGWPGYDVAELYPQYVQRHGGMIRYLAWSAEQEGVTRVHGGLEADLVFPCSHMLRRWYATGRIAPIDTARIDNWAQILPSLKQIEGATRDGKPVWVPVDWGQTSIVYRTDLAPDYVDDQSWRILWDQKYRGRVAAFEQRIDVGVVAGLMAGLPDVWNYTDAGHATLAREKMRALNAQVRFRSDDPAMLEGALASGEIVAATAWNESVIRLKTQGLPVAFMRPREGAVTWVCGLSIVQGTRHLDKVYDVINAMLSKSSRTWSIREFGFGASTREAFAATDSQVLARRGLGKNPEELLRSSIFQAEIRGEAAFRKVLDEELW